MTRQEIRAAIERNTKAMAGALPGSGAALTKEAILTSEHQRLLTELVTISVDEHAMALTKAADASDRYSRSIGRATWALFGVTLALVLVAIVQLVIMIGRA